MKIRVTKDGKPVQGAKILNKLVKSLGCLSYKQVSLEKKNEVLKVKKIEVRKCRRLRKRKRRYFLKRRVQRKVYTRRTRASIGRGRRLEKTRRNRTVYKRVVSKTVKVEKVVAHYSEVLLANVAKFDEKDAAFILKCK